MIRPPLQPFATGRNGCSRWCMGHSNPAAPWCAGSQHPADAIEDASIVHTRHASRLVRQHRPDGRPFIIREFAAHHTRLRFGSLYNVQRGTINRQRSVDSTCAFRGLCCKTQKRAGDKISRRIRQNGYSAMPWLVKSLRRLSVRNRINHVTPLSLIHISEPTRPY